MTSSTDTPPAPLSAVDVAGLSREGRRASNEDSAAWVAYGEGSSVSGYVVVCDGMGGHNAGEVASSMALRLLQTRIGELASEPEVTADPAVLAGRVGAWISEINVDIRKSASSNRDQAGMGTTLALALAMSDGRLVVANVGDSKVFLVRGVVIQQLSVDHTALAEQRRILNKDSGSALDDAANPFFHALTRSLGQEADVAPDIRADVVLRPGDLVVVTSDGVTDVLESERFLSIVEGSQSLSEVAETTYRLSFEAGSRDNITVALLARGKPIRLGSAPPPSGEIDLDGTVPMTRVRTVPKPVSGGTAMADGGRGPAVPPPPGPRKSLKTPFLIGAAALFGCLAALVFWLTGKPSPREEIPAVADARPTVAPPATPGGEGKPVAPVVTAPAAVPASPAAGRPGDEYEVPRAEEVPTRAPVRPTAEGPVFRVPTAMPRPETKLSVPSVASVPTPVPASPGPRATPTTRVAEKPATMVPPPIAVLPTAPPPATAPAVPQAAEANLAVPGREASLREVEVHVQTGSKRYKFIFRFDRPVAGPAGKGGAYSIPNDIIKVWSVRQGRDTISNERDREWSGYPLRYDRSVEKVRNETCLEFILKFASTDNKDSSPLVENEEVQLDLRNLEWLFGRASINAKVFVH